jgi:hypothetical protein
VASLDQVYLLGTGSWVGEFSGPVRVLMPGYRAIEPGRRRCHVYLTPVGKARSRAPSSKGKRAVIEALLDSGADPAAGMPSAVETAWMFGLDDLFALFEDR